MDRRRRWPALVLVLFVLLVVATAGLFLTRDLWSEFLFNVTGERELSGQVRGGLEWLGNVTRRSPGTADDVPIANAGMNPYGVNTFLEQEVEPAKREQAVEMIAEAGFHWIRQEFPWEDIEIHAKGDFEDRRHEPYRSAWGKYDHIVDLAGQYDLEIIARLSNPPAWSRVRGNDGGAFAPPDDLADYGDYVQAVVERYGDRIKTYQIWNEPNIYPEWGDRQVSPEEYAELLKVGYTRVKESCPECVVVSGALAQTIPLGPRDLNDFIFLQRMYDAGAGDFFDVLAMQGYGLWSGPTDRRMRPRVLNFSRPRYLREIMVENGDAHKPLWITEMNWNAPPPDLPDKQFGLVTLEEQAENAVLAYQRAREEWPWVGIVTTWFFKRATDAEADQAMYYFRLVEPDFSPLPVYETLKETMNQPPVLYPGIAQEDHWALNYSGPWKTVDDPAAELGAYRLTDGNDAAVSLTFDGTDLWLTTGPAAEGDLAYSLDGEPEETVAYASGADVRLAEALPRGTHTLAIRPAGDALSIDSLTVQDKKPITLWPIVAGAAFILAIIITTLAIRRSRPARRWYEHDRGP